MDNKSDCLCGCECQKPCIALQQLQQEMDAVKEELANKVNKVNLTVAPPSAFVYPTTAPVEKCGCVYDTCADCSPWS